MKRLLLACLACVCGVLVAKPSLPLVFGDHMVLQRGMTVPVWGNADAGETITVSFAGQEKSATADASGRWLVKLDPLAASAKPRELLVHSVDGKVRFTDVLVGEVWLCSGQSNMEKPLGAQRGQKPVFNADEEIRNARFPQIRLLKIKQTRAGEPAADVVLTTPWTACAPETIDAIKFSAAGYFFGRKLHRELNVPIGLIDASWGGALIEPWTAPEGFDTVPELAAYAAASRKPSAKVDRAKPSSIYNAMVHPLVPYAMRGVIWYQGETNLMDLNDSALYSKKMIALVQGWRAVWKSDLAFYYVQIAPHLYHVVRSARVVRADDCAYFWEAQADAMKTIPHSGMIVTTDLADDLFDIHPRNKLDVGERLARWALAKDYARKGIVFSGPVFQSMEVNGNCAYLTFEHVDGGLVAKDGKPLRWFIVAGDDGVFHPAQAIIEGERVIVSNSKVAEPKVVRFAWDEAAQPNLFNGAGLPAMPFRTDAAR